MGLLKATAEPLVGHGISPQNWKVVHGPRLCSFQAIKQLLENADVWFSFLYFQTTPPPSPCVCAHMRTCIAHEHICKNPHKGQKCVLPFLLVCFETSSSLAWSCALLAQLADPGDSRDLPPPHLISARITEKQCTPDFLHGL